MKTKGIAEFLAVANSSSFTTAGRSLGLSVAHISRTVGALEEELGVKLFNRTTRSVRLTQAGETLHADCLEASQVLERAIEKVQSNEQSLSGRIRLACVAGSFAETVVAPALAVFAAAHPNVELDVDFDSRRVDIIRDGYDAAIRAGDISDRSLQSIRLASRKRVAAASPAYLARAGCPNHPADLKDHECIRTFSNLWAFTENDRQREIEVSGRLRFNSGIAIRAACEQGLGIAYMAEQGFGDAFHQEHLVPVLKPYWRTDADISIIFPAKSFLSSRLNALIHYIVTQSERENGLNTAR